VAIRRQCAYVVAKSDLPAGSTVEFRAVGGVALADRPAAFRAEVLGALAQADAVTVRDAVTRDFLAANGIAAELVRDPVSRIAELFGDEIRARRPATADFLAVQFAAEWGDDATLAQLARGLERLGKPVVLFRAGAAPWHDDLEPYRRLAARLAVPATIFESLDIRDICGLIAGAASVVATSLHVRIVAEAFGVPAISLEQRRGSAGKLRAYLRTWQPDATPVVLDEFAEGA
jgi:polysaccharide pyruvyl transferase WcaK-like protein